MLIQFHQRQLHAPNKEKKKEPKIIIVIITIKKHSLQSQEKTV